MPLAVSAAVRLATRLSSTLTMLCSVHRSSHPHSVPLTNSLGIVGERSSGVWIMCGV